MMNRKLLLDLDGTLLNGLEAINGSPDFIKELDRQNIDFQIMTNSIKSPREICRRLSQAGMDVKEEKILNPVTAINSYLRAKSIERVYTAGSILEREQVKARQDFENPEIVVLLDFEKDNADYNELQHIFALIQKGIPVIAASGSTYYLKSGISFLDTGAFVKLLESAGNISISIFGKPSPAYFEEASRLLGSTGQEIYVIGDDWQTDVSGARSSGMTPLLIRSGKYKSGDEAQIPGTCCIDTLSEVFGYLS